VFSWGLACQRLGYYLQNAGKVLQDLVVPEAENPPTRLCQSSVADHVGAGSPVLTAIGFDDQPSFNASEVHHVGRDRILPPTASPELFVP